MSSDRQDAPEDDWEDEEFEDAPRSIFAAGWFRAVLVLTVLAIIVVVTLPYMLNWFEPTPVAVKASSPTGPPAEKSSGPAVSVSPTPAAPAPTAPPLTVAPPPAPSLDRPRPAPSATAAPPPAPSASPSRPGRAVAMSPGPTRARESDGGRYWVQLGLFKDGANAEQLARQVRGQGFSVDVARVTRSTGGSLPAGTYHVVRAGSFRDQTRALAALSALQDKGYKGFLAEGGAQ